MFYRDSRQIYRVSELDALPWLVHGFATRLAQPPAGIAVLKQVHSADCVLGEGRRGHLGQGDALLENTPGSLVGVKTADCVPILLVDEQHRAVAAVHAGWRGTAAQIVRNAAEEMGRHFGTRPADLHAAIGPSIGACCYEVGPEVACHFGQEGRCHIDLCEANRKQLNRAGVSPGRIYEAGLCTMCMAEQFHSYRRDRAGAGRMLSFAGVRQAVQ
jgi:YfiH family protein